MTQEVRDVCRYQQWTHLENLEIQIDLTITVFYLSAIQVVSDPTP
jgi:hypothetical protein